MKSLFTSDSVSTEPFYVWTNKNWKVSKDYCLLYVCMYVCTSNIRFYNIIVLFQNTISQLLAGKKIHLKADADVDMGGQFSASFFKSKSAIKFKTIQLVLKSSNKI